MDENVLELELDLHAEELSEQVTAGFNCNGTFACLASWGSSVSSGSTLACS